MTAFRSLRVSGCRNPPADQRIDLRFTQLDAEVAHPPTTAVPVTPHALGGVSGASGSGEGIKTVSSSFMAELPIVGQRLQGFAVTHDAGGVVW